MFCLLFVHFMGNHILPFVFWHKTIVKYRTVCVLPLCVMLCCVVFWILDLKAPPIPYDLKYSSIRIAAFSVTFQFMILLSRSGIGPKSSGTFRSKVLGTTLSSWLIIKGWETGRKYGAWNCCYLSTEDSGRFMIQGSAL